MTTPSAHLMCQFVVGDRVQLHPATDLWMRGDRYGTIERLVETPYIVGLVACVRMDRSHRLQRIRLKNLQPVEG